jgi:hypothetical protein
MLIANGVPKRKYLALCRATLADGRVIEDMVIEQGWIVALDRTGLAGNFERRIDLDPRTISYIEIKQVV